MTTGLGGHGHPQSSQAEINNNSNSQNAENNNNNFAVSDYDDEENTSEYGQSPGTEQLRNPLHDFSNLSGSGSSETAKEQELSNRLNNNSNSCCSKSIAAQDVLASSTDSDNILNNNPNNNDEEVPEAADNVARGVGQANLSTATTGAQKDSNHNHNQVVSQSLKVN